MSVPTLDALNAAHAIDGMLRFEAGEGGLTRGVIESPACDGEFYLHGAQVTRWRPLGYEDVLWLSPAARFEDGRAIRGGTPLCFPWFGAHPEDDAAPSHGLARGRSWEFHAARRLDDAIQVEFTTTIAPWACRLSASFGDTLTIALEVRNDSTEHASFEAALHTYLAVSEVSAVVLSGLEEAAFIDMTDRRSDRDAEGEPLRVRGEVDRLYPGHTGLVTVCDESRLIEVDGAGSYSTVVWNPGPERAAQLADLGDGWRQMVCVETANIADDRVTLSPAGTWRMSTTIRPRPSPTPKRAS